MRPIAVVHDDLDVVNLIPHQRGVILDAECVRTTQRTAEELRFQECGLTDEPLVAGRNGKGDETFRGQRFSVSDAPTTKVEASNLKPLVAGETSPSESVEMNPYKLYDEKYFIPDENQLLRGGAPPP